jgi:hypothetical protein
LLPMKALSSRASISPSMGAWLRSSPDATAVGVDFTPRSSLPTSLGDRRDAQGGAPKRPFEASRPRAHQAQSKARTKRLLRRRSEARTTRARRTHSA